MSELREYLAELLKDPGFSAEYEAMRPESEAIRAMISARLECHMTQKELAERTGIQHQPDRKR